MKNKKIKKQKRIGLSALTQLIKQNKNIKNFNLKEEYKKSLDYIKESKKFIYLIIIIFSVFALIGFFVPASEPLKNQILEFIKELLEKTQNMSQAELIKFLFFNNLQSSFYGLIFGVLIGIFPITATIANGYLLGFVASMSVENGGIMVLWKLFPHGIFELPAVFISLGLGLKLGTFILKKEKLKSFNEYFINSLRVFLLIVIPLLAIAGIIEGSFIFLMG
jgi:stage II sporulation protein M